MNVGQITEITKKIEDAKIEKSKAAGIIEQIEKRWKDEYDLSSLEEAKERVKTYTNQIESLEKKSNTLLEELEEKAEELDLV